MNFLPCIVALTLSGLLFSAADRPQGDSCDVLPSGYCHDRTTRDREFVRQWNENKGRGNNSGNNSGNDGGNPFVRRRLVDVQTPPDYGVSPFAPGEYEQVEGILLAFDGSSDGNSVYDLDVVAGIAAAVTNPSLQSTETKVYMVVSNAAQKAKAQEFFTAANVNMDWVVWVEEPVDSVWIRDYGPRFICDPSALVRAAVDTRYYSSRPNDNTLPTKLGNGNEVGPHNNHDLNQEVMHSGGNGHYFSTGKAFSSDLLLLDNDGAVEETMKNYWTDYKGADLHLFKQLDFAVDGTGHIDMWFLPVSDDAVIVGEFAKEDRFDSKARTDAAAAYMANQGYTVYRVPNWSGRKVYGRSTHYTYTNAIIANDVVVLSSFGDVSEGRDAVALEVFRTAFPDRTVVQVDSSGIITRSGALHCIAQHVYDCGGSGPVTTISPPATTTTAVTTTAATTTTTTTQGNSSCAAQGPPGCQVGGACSKSCQDCCCSNTNLGGGSKVCNE